MASFQMLKRVQKSTTGKLWNSSSQTLTLTDKKVWQGSHYTEFPETIQDGDNGEFTHDADEGEFSGSIVGLVYRRRDGTRWVIAWSNPLLGESKVFTDIQQQPIHWGQIKTNLDKRGKQKFKVSKFGYIASVEIDPFTVKASFELEP
ncbi:hypothetical protein ERO13_D05G285600v2 [Gossypium hirsutum]|uniref:Uncharacterized protein n=9 Tax=Gossypium TaxID=3633 RepID=A0A0D2QQK3_GOSRA|nr:uncharacterized protein LOC105771317 [Gossypium raimondii]XP_040950556.1 uncharacterized protein LOC121217932 [Gossypium hirsutum]KAB2031379.1 hypothetical protein ES319_D05G301300v1 [Gossypium barbadense]MBA0624333.1 hypothetical protein [Gossypium davidsonii]MBA0659925.1 hypothetical protein [Gossypium klotzschianum]TYG70483.1 hypothetical protein ES288_D05G317700v1 [Gossypium darwinii]TYH73269.1 hypothetical protein ES332_D05G317400v1 [Gossypium tomentosum]TYI83654.1 hypothetical prote